MDETTLRNTPPTTKTLASPVEGDLLRKSSDIHGEGNFPQGCAFSPDGLCILTAIGSSLRLYNTYVAAGEENQSSGTVDNDIATSQDPVSTHGDVNTDQNNNHKDDWKSVLNCPTGETVRSYAWYPHMKSNDAASCCFVAACRDQPIHLYDAYTGSVRAYYRPYNALDELDAPAVVAFAPDGQSIVAGGFRTDRTLHVFATARPGRDSCIWRLGKTRKSSDGQKGLVSALAYSGAGTNCNVLAVGTYSPGSIYIYDQRTNIPAGTILDGVCVVGHGKNWRRNKRKRRNENANNSSNKIDEPTTPPENEEDEDDDWWTMAKMNWFMQRAQGGVTQLQFSSSNTTLYSASRRSDAILAWDLRMLSDNTDALSSPKPIFGIASYSTCSDTNQRLEFDLDDTANTLYVGGLDRCVRIYDVTSRKLIGTIQQLEDAVNGVSCCCSAGSQTHTKLLAVTTGSRRFPALDDEYDDDTSNETSMPTFSSTENEVCPGSLRLYKL